jgi:hypothetical protein
MSKKTWSKPNVSNMNLEPLPPYRKNANGCLAVFLLIVFSFVALSAKAQTVTGSVLFEILSKLISLPCETSHPRKGIF